MYVGFDISLCVSQSFVVGHLQDEGKIKCLVGQISEEIMRTSALGTGYIFIYSVEHVLRHQTAPLNFPYRPCMTSPAALETSPLLY